MTVKEQSQKQEQEQTSLAKYNFFKTCKSSATLETYTNAIHYFMDFLKIGREEYDRLLEKDPKLIQMDICHVIEDYLENQSPARCSP
jgi:hypothetical protein